jgi:cyclic pyranopterin phosphate synthase
MLSRSCRTVARHRVTTRTTASKTLSHVDAAKGLPRMVDVSNKTTTARRAVARCRVVFPPDAWDALTASGFAGKKGPVLATAVVAGVQGAKRTSELIPFCHPVALDACDVSFEEQELSLEVTCAVTTTHRTGVEMEALSGASIAALAVYDMTKALSHSITIEDLRLVEKTGGKSDYKT